MNNMIWAAPVYIGCIVEIPFDVRSFSQVNLTATDQTDEFENQSLPH